MKEEIILQVKGLSKHYASVKALDNIDFDLRRGEILCLCGENGAGKTTLIKILSGVESPTKGEIIYEGKPTVFTSPLHAHNLGISTVYQEMVQMTKMSVAENIYLGRYKKRYGLVDIAEAENRAGEFLREIGLNISAATNVGDLSLAQRQMVEIAKALSFDSKVIIFDEPTSSMSDEETRTLFRIIRQLKAAGVSIIYISHRLNEIFQIADRISVLRDGEVVGTALAEDSNIDEIILMMVGRELSQQYPKRTASKGEKVLEVKGLSDAKIDDCNFDLFRGEVLGFGGLIGAGRTELMELIFGLAVPSKGEVKVNGQVIAKRSPSRSIRYGISLVPEDRRKQGLISMMLIKHNISLSILRAISKIGIIDKHRENKLTSDIADRLRIKAPSTLVTASTLSGGNQQKVVIARALLPNPEILIMDEPTRGIDVGAKAEIYQIIKQLTEAGVAVIMISSDLPELIAMSDRILVMCEGRITGELSQKDMNERKVMELATLGETLHEHE